MTQDVDTVPRRRPSVGNRILGVVGELSMTLGVLLLLFVAYQLWWTNLSADRAAGEAAQTLQEQWRAAPAPKPDPDDDEEGQPDLPELGSAFALAYIPRLKSSVWGLPINGGIDPASLARGLGHYPQSALPGEIGNFAVAGHRATNGEPLRNVDLLRAGDEVVIETREQWFVYRLVRDQIVTPDSGWVVEPVPGDPTATPKQALITVTTCHPRWASTQRWVWWGELAQTLDRSSGEVPEAVRS